MLIRYSIILIFSFCLRAIADTETQEKVFIYGNPNSPLPAIRIVGDQDYPPIEWLENGEAKGIFPSILPALAKEMGRKIEYRLIDWKQAQLQVLNKQADVLTVFSPNEQRKQHYDFVDGFLQFELSLFVRDNNLTIHDLDDLREIKTGVTKGGYLRNLLARNSEADQIIITNHLSGFQKLLKGEIDALATTKWVGAYTIQKY